MCLSSDVVSILLVYSVAQVRHARPPRHSQDGGGSVTRLRDLRMMMEGSTLTVKEWVPKGAVVVKKAPVYYKNVYIKSVIF